MKTGDKVVEALERVNLTLSEGEIKALVGESGSGKTLLVKAILGSLPDYWYVKADRLTYKGQDLINMSYAERREIMRRDIAVVFQDPSASLDPTIKLLDQVIESIPEELAPKSSFLKRKKQLKEHAISLLLKVGIKDYERWLKCYPHEVPEDICQKIMIAMALASEPTILIADDPTRGMGTATKSQLLQLLLKLNQTKDLSILFVSHDLLSVTSIANSMTVIYCGQTVESGKVKSLLKRPLHPYTKALLDSAPSVQDNLPAKSTLKTLGGSIPSFKSLPIGCRLGPRCPQAKKECVQMPNIRSVHDHIYSCHFPLHLVNKESKMINHINTANPLSDKGE